MKIKYFKYAKNMAKMSEFNKFKVGCIIVYKNKIIGQGYNSDKTHPLQQLYNQLRFEDDGVSPHKLHAEMHALIPIRNLDIDWNKVSVYIYRIKKSNKNGFGMARPCLSCMGLIKELGIKEINYTTEDGFANEIIYKK